MQRGFTYQITEAMDFTNNRTKNLKKMAMVCQQWLAQTRGENRERESVEFYFQNGYKANKNYPQNAEVMGLLNQNLKSLGWQKWKIGNGGLVRNREETKREI